MTGVEIPKFTIISYIRDRKRRPLGALVAIKDASGRGFRIGYSLCNKQDRFSRSTAVKIALDRANGQSDEQTNPPHIVRRSIPSFMERCSRYYE